MLLIEPQFLNDLDVAAQHLPAETLHWAHSGWEGGEDAHGPAPISSFAAIDAILARLADRASFPALRNVVVAGHSGGGQLVQRYAIAGRGESALNKAGIHVRYVVSNPSSYAYFSPERPTGDGFATFDAAACPSYDRWKYGMTGLPTYLAGEDPAALEAAYAARDVVYLLGQAMTTPTIGRSTRPAWPKPKGLIVMPAASPISVTCNGATRSASRIACCGRRV